MHYTLAFDTTDDKHRNKFAKILKDFGKRVKYNVFECNIERRACLRLQDWSEKGHDKPSYID